MPLIVPAIGAVLFYFAFKSFLDTRKRGYGERTDKSKNRLSALLVSFAVFGALWYLLFYLATSGIFGGAAGGLRLWI